MPRKGSAKFCHNISFQEERDPGCRIFTPAALGLCTWEMSLPCLAHFGLLQLNLSGLEDLQMGPWMCKWQLSL